VRLVHNGHAALEPLPFPPEPPVRFGYLARFRPEKGHARLLDALVRVRTDVPWEVELGGDGPLEDEVRSAVRDRGLWDLVRFAGRADDPRAFWARQHAGLLLSDTEGSPNCLIEAAFAGRPLVATGVGGTPDVVAPDGGYVVPTDDPDATARALEALIEDAGLRTRMGQRARAHAEGSFTLGAFVAGHVGALGEVLMDAR
jgi:glycosyltransferase involved in cell wall biosynthesis